MKIGNIISVGEITARDILAEVVRETGPVPTCRVSSAQSSTQYAYWDTVRYEIRLRRADGAPINVSTERATSSYRSYGKAQRLLCELADAEDRLIVQQIGEITEDDARAILAGLRQREEVSCV